jgi:NADPH:quinone reductase-like Zn-dependent oxidoreductase
MKAFVVERYGSEAGARMREVPEPEVGDHEVLVQVRAASVNPLDVKIRDDEFKRILPYRVPFVLGHDMAGEVARVGSAVMSFAPGVEVYARPRKDRIGTFAELIAVHPLDGGGGRATPRRADRVVGARRARGPSRRVR